MSFLQIQKCHIQILVFLEVLFTDSSSKHLVHICFSTPEATLFLVSQMLFACHNSLNHHSHTAY